MWNRRGRPPLHPFWDFLRELGAQPGQGRPPAVRPVFQGGLTIDGADLYRRARAAARKAGGCDGWTGKLWAALPRQFFDKLAGIWQRVLEGADIPAPWLQVSWERALAQLTSWASRAFPVELCGGVSGRDTSDVHAALCRDMFVQRRGGPLAGCKADIRKCFDTASPTLAAEAFQWLGGPPVIAALLERFYRSHERWITNQCFVAPRPVKDAAALQGCPLSPLMLNCLMAVWCRTVRLRSPEIRFALFLDDRTLWNRGARPAAQVHQAMLEGGRADAVMGFTLHPDKLESFGTSHGTREALFAVSDVVGIPQVTFTLLGVKYNVDRADPVNAGVLTDKLVRRCRRIRWAGPTVKQRVFLVGIMVISLFRWCAPWVRFYKHNLHKWRTHIESAVWGRAPPPGRSPAIFWSALATVSLHPEFALTEATLLSERKRLRDGRHLARATRTLAAFKEMGRTVEGDVWSTPHGPFHPGQVSQAFLRRALRDDWTRRLLLRDPKVAGQQVAEDFVLSFHQKEVHATNWAGLRVLAAAVVDSRVLARRRCALPCVCGEQGPSHTHVTFDCEARPWTAARRTAVERRMLVPLGLVAPAFVDGDVEASIEEVVRYVQRLPLDFDIVIATDGGCLVHPGLDAHQRAAWAVVFYEGACFSGLVPGPEQIAAADERTALLIVAVALTRGNRQGKLLIDNLPGFTRGGPGVRRATRGRHGDASPALVN
ncbi:Cacna1h [Symbiodinium sp. CCMP2592]|nr:Cacna1h [Symbiodinium sp. CCMP2592]